MWRKSKVKAHVLGLAPDFRESFLCSSLVALCCIDIFVSRSEQPPWRDEAVRPKSISFSHATTATKKLPKRHQKPFFFSQRFSLSPLAQVDSNADSPQAIAAGISPSKLRQGSAPHCEQGQENPNSWKALPTHYLFAELDKEEKKEEPAKVPSYHQENDPCRRDLTHISNIVALIHMEAPESISEDDSTSESDTEDSDSDHGGGSGRRGNGDDILTKRVRRVMRQDPNKDYKYKCPSCQFSKGINKGSPRILTHI